MARYDLSDPRLQTAIEELAAKAAANWPPLDDMRRAELARLLAPAATPRPLRLPVREQAA